MKNLLQTLHRKLGPSVLRLLAAFSLLTLPWLFVLMLFLPEYAVILLLGFALAAALGGILLTAAGEAYR